MKDMLLDANSLPARRFQAGTTKIHPSRRAEKVHLEARSLVP
jgi:hypothetical protein